MADDPRAAALIASAQRLGANPLDLATVISYETGGTFDPSIRGGAGRRCTAQRSAAVTRACR